MGILAAAALLIGYVVTVAVSVSAGVAALTSIAPQLYPERVPIAVGAVALLMLGNLRGIRESGTIFMAPTYLYVTVMLGIIGIGVARSLLGDLDRFVAPQEWVGLDQGGQALGLFLILRAFSQGAVALTGVEAISDGVPAFKPPEMAQRADDVDLGRGHLCGALRGDRLPGHDDRGGARPEPSGRPCSA